MKVFSNSVKAAAALATAFAISASGLLAFAPVAFADVDPGGCTDNGGGISVAAFRADGVTNIGVGTVADGELIKYQASLFAAPFPPNCAFQGGTWTLTTPDGVVHPLGAVPRIGGTGVASLSSSLISYTVAHGDEISNGTRHINASTAYGGGISHADANDQTNGPTLGASKILTVIHTPIVTTNVHNTAHGVITSAPIGSTVHDNASVAPVGTTTAPTGTVDFAIFSNITCSGATTTVQSGVALVAGVAESATTSTPSTGLSYKAHYNGQPGMYTPADGACEPLEATKLSPTIATTQSAGGVVGTVLNDTAALSGGFNPTGTVTFKLFAPSDATCQGPAVYTEADPSAPYATSPGYTSIAVGTYRWTADYAGDANNNPVSSGCQDETVVITKASPGIQTTPSAGGAIGTVLNDTATLSGGSSPTGNVTFKLFAPGDITCSAAALYTEIDPSAPYATSPGFTSLNAGTYRWTADYAGDANNNAVSSGCQDELVVIGKSSPTIATVPSAGGNIGTVLNDTATLSGGSSPTGTVTFTLYPPSDATCSAAAVYTDADPTAPYATSPGYASIAAGVYHWKAAYAGDANNNAVTSPCADEAVTIIQPTGHIIVDKVTNPSGSLQLFHFGVTGTGYIPFDLADATAPNDQTLNAGSYSVVETSVSGWNQTSAVCTDGSATSSPSSINLLPGHTVSCVFTNTFVAQYCSPGYWKQDQHFDSYVTYHPTDLFDTVFGRAVFPGMTLVQVLSQGGGGLNAYGRKAVGALLNSTSMSSGLTAAQVIAAFQATFDGAPTGKANDYYGGANPGFTAPENCPLN